jgi:hypothetical protein
MRRLPLIILTFALALTSCFKEDELVPAHEQGELEVGTAALGPNYTSQVYYSLANNTEIASNLFTDWDLAFESSGGGWTIRLNSSKFMVAGNSHDTLFARELRDSALDMIFDPSSGNPDSTAIGTWYEMDGQGPISLRHVYLVDRGMNEKGQKLGYRKVQFEMADNGYRIRIADPDRSGDTTLIIQRDESKAWIHYSFDLGIVDTYPDADTWTLLFSKYTTMLVTNEGENYPYLVTGVLLNPLGVSAMRDTIHDFDEFVLADTVDLKLTARNDVIGYSWKYYNFDAGLYTMVPGYSYIIRDLDGFYYKLRFIDFYNETGEKGFPKFEFVRL